MNEPIKNFYDLDAWKKGHIMVIKVYELTNTFPKEELYGVTSQIRRAVSSITANLAEGFARYYFKDKVRFYYNSRGSAAEVQNFLLLARDLNHIDCKECERLVQEIDEISKLINGLIKSIEKQIN